MDHQEVTNSETRKRKAMNSPPLELGSEETLINPSQSEEKKAIDLLHLLVKAWPKSISMREKLWNQQNALFVLDCDDLVPHQDAGRAEKKILSRGIRKETFRAEAQNKVDVVVKTLAYGEEEKEVIDLEWKRWLELAGSLPFHPNLTCVGVVRSPYSLGLVTLSADNTLADFLLDTRDSGSVEAEKEAKQDTLPWTQRGQVVRDVAQGMIHLHASNQVHGALKPENILCFGKRWIVADYVNFERMMLAEDTKRWFGSSFQTEDRRHQAPEYLTNAGPASDVFSFGIILFELITLTRTYPHPSRTPKVVSLRDVIKLQEERQERQGPVPDGYVALIKKCLREEVRDRPSFEEIMSELNKIVF
jgi:serine/threonine protein kinase